MSTGSRFLLLAAAPTLSMLWCTCAGQPVVLESAAAEAPTDVGQRAYQHVENLVGFGERYPSSKGWKKAIAYIQRELGDMGLKPRLDSWSDGGENIEFTNIHVTLPGASPDKIVIGCHHDTKRCAGHPDPENNFYFVGANDSASGVGLLLELARALKDRPRTATFELVFFDGEESIPFHWDMERALFGSKHYVRNYLRSITEEPEAARIHAFVLLDMVGAKDLQIDDDQNSDAELKRIFFAAAAATGHADYFFEHHLSVIDDHIPFTEAHIRSIDLIDLVDNPHWHTAGDGLLEIAPESLQIVGEVVLTALPALERRYFSPDKPESEARSSN